MDAIGAYRLATDQVYPVYKDPNSTDESKTSLQRLQDKLDIHVVKLDETEFIFDLVGVDASLANALRRIIIAEVPTMAIETIHMHENTSILHDEVLAHRLGLVPIMADPDQFDDLPPGADPTETNTIVFKLDQGFKLSKQSGGGIQSAIHAPAMSLYSGTLTWVPTGSQAEKFPEGSIRPVHDDILLAKLKPGQRIKLEAWCRKGVGKDHAKFSPVSTASYRLLPDITFTEEVTGSLAEELVAKCPMNVFEIEDLGSVQRATVARPRDCSMCRECIREEGWSERVKLKRVADHFIFSIESVGNIKPEVILKQAIKVLRQKCEALLEATELDDAIPT